MEILGYTIEVKRIEEENVTPYYEINIITKSGRIVKNKIIESTEDVTQASIEASIADTNSEIHKELEALINNTN
ncbi:MAG: hypothetical protein RG740_05035 [Acholeplasmataceae bacterium]|nr:hypothetical protein [Acholeplasmataceae bacterium]